MKKFFTMTIILLGFLITYIMPASGSDSYEVRLKSRTWLPPVNSANLFSIRPQVQKLQAGKLHVLVQFSSIPTESQHEAMKQAGLILHDYIPNFAYSATIEDGFTLEKAAEFGIRHISLFDFRDKVEENLLAGRLGSLPEDTSKVYVYLLVYSDVPLIAAINSLTTDYPSEVKESSEDFKVMSVILRRADLNAVADKEWVSWIEAVLPFKERNDGSRTLIRVNQVQAAPYYLTGTELNLGMWDGGKIYTHDDFTGRLVNKTNYIISEHATHVAGTLAGNGDGSTNNSLRGMATSANIYNWSYLVDNGQYKTWSIIAQEMKDGMTNNGIVLSQNSWGDDGGGTYTVGARLMDQVIREKNISVVFSVGYGGHVYNSMQSPETGKNLIAVTATTKTGEEYFDASSGPCLDGRLKPDIAAAGVSIVSTNTSNGYRTETGTSMAAPAISGTIGLMIDRYRNRCGTITNPSAELIKAILLNTATDIGNPGPDYFYGYGLTNAQEAIKTVDAATHLTDHVPPGGTNNHTLQVPSGLSRLRVMVVWTDPEAAVNADPALINNLNLKLISPTNTEYLPLTLNSRNPSVNATPSINNRDNVEQVDINNPVTGTWTMRVMGTIVTSKFQSYALTWHFSTLPISKNVAAGWNMSSIPNMVDDLAKTTLWSTANSSAFNYEDGSYKTKDTLSNGLGYWIRFPANQTITYTGVPVYSFCIPVFTDWNMIGSLSTDINRSKITPVNTSITSEYFGYNGSYFPTDNIQAGKGYWIKVSDPGHLLMDANTQSGGGTLPCGQQPPNPDEAPPIPVLASPSDGAVGVSTSPTLSWYESYGTTSYRLQVSTNCCFTTLVFDYPNLTSTSKQIGTLLYSTTYYWRVNASNDVAISSWSDTRSITTQSAPGGGDPCHPYSSITAMDEFTITDGNGNRQSMYARNGGRGLALGRMDDEMPPEPLGGAFNARFRSGKFFETLPPGKSLMKLPIKIKDASYPLTIGWNIRPENSTSYWLEIPGKGQQKIPLTGSGNMNY
ncbi:MAG: S8 family serine peptidase [Bacteroidota bacterium]|nr:S8 family serine peptidase [Bacteroidota bacterium]